MNLIFISHISFIEWCSMSPVFMEIESIPFHSCCQYYIIIIMLLMCLVFNGINNWLHPIQFILIHILCIGKHVVFTIRSVCKWCLHSQLGAFIQQFIRSFNFLSDHFIHSSFLLFNIRGEKNFVALRLPVAFSVFFFVFIPNATAAKSSYDLLKAADFFLVQKRDVNH